MAMVGVRIEVLHLEPGQFAVSAARLQRRAHKRTEVGVASIEQPLRFGKVEIAHSRHFHFAERFELAAPCVTVADVAFVVGVVERSLQHRQYAVGAGATAAHRLIALRSGLVLRHACFRASLFRAGGERRQPTA